ncbi:MAG: ABC transporter ATP-binding protein [Gemmatimonadota bacterium]|nr:ABC transporter ATP-binding protein [Gemmatimonadota bacterium]
MTDSLLEVTNLSTEFDTERGTAHAVRSVSLSLGPGETLGLVGESGCGKSVTALSILGLLPAKRARILDGSSVRFRGEELLSAGPGRLRQIRGNEIGMVFQEPMTSLNPVLRVGEQIAETIREHEGGRTGAIRDRVAELLDRVGIPDPGSRYNAYPHQLSGGMRQRVMLAIALACGPDLLIADEPTTALDVTIQAQILDLLDVLRRELGMALLLISHDLGVVARVADRVAVMYAGRIVERGRIPELFAAPAHPYTQGLLRAIPRLDARPGPLAAIPGQVPDPHDEQAGCPFAPRCPDVMPICRTELPTEYSSSAGSACCWLARPAD